MFLCASRLPSFAPRLRMLRGSQNQITAGLPNLSIITAPPIERLGRSSEGRSSERGRGGVDVAVMVR